MSEIHEKVNDPLTEARMGGYIDTAQEFFLYNIADKVCARGNNSTCLGVIAFFLFPTPRCNPASFL